jgi:hypothetical protein
LSTAQFMTGTWRLIEALTTGAQLEASTSLDSVLNGNRLPTVLIGSPR